MLTGNQLRQKYLDFFVARGHSRIPSAPLVPENDPTTLFTGSGMQPMLPYLLGQSHPLGTRLVDSQKCFRSQDIEEVGDNRHDSFFEMLGNWSLGDYFKKEQLPWFFEFLTKELGLDPHSLYVSVFAGDEKFNLSPDNETITIWQEIFASVGIEAKVGERIFLYPASKNWWSRSGPPDSMPAGEPGGPDSEVFYDFGPTLKLHENSPVKNQKCHINCDCGRYLEIGNSVFMQYQKMPDGSLKELPQKNVDFGGGFERILTALNNNPDQFLTDLYMPVISEIETLTHKSYPDNQFSFRIIADHIKAAAFLIADGVIPSNKAQGYFLRRLLRRAMVKMQKLTDSAPEYSAISSAVIDIYKDAYPELAAKEKYIHEVIQEENNRFSKTMSKGLREFNKLNSVDGKVAFDLFQTYGFPLEVTMELAAEKNINVDKDQFAFEFKKHQELSRTASQGMFKGGLQDQSETTTKYHTATHLLHKALRDILGTHVQQKGSNITAERLRFDFSHPVKLTADELQLIEAAVNQKILENLPVHHDQQNKNEALSQGAMAFFPEKYPDIASVYTIGDPGHWYSKELCGGPHVASTGEIGKIKIIKEESAGAGIRRIYAKIVNS